MAWVPDYTAPAFASRVDLPVLVEWEEDFEGGLAEAVSKIDDRFWSYYVTRPFSWQRLANWWAARRWIQPRDVRRR